MRLFFSIIEILYVTVNFKERNRFILGSNMTGKERIPTNLRTLLILEILGKHNRAMTATEINDSLRLPKQTVHRLCSTLEENGFLTRVGHTKRYQAARRLRDLGMGYYITLGITLHVVRFC